MKKIIALAVASAFVAPAFAAEVTVSGDVEFKYSKVSENGISQSLDGDSDFFVSASDNFDGLGVVFKVGFEDVARSKNDNPVAGNDNMVGDAELHLSGSFGTVMLGNVDTAAELYDEYSHVAEDGGAAAIVGLADATGNNSTITYVLPTLVDGLSVAASATIENGLSSTTDDELMHTAVGIKYTNGAFTATYGQLEQDGQAFTETVYGAQYKIGPVTVAIEQGNDIGSAGSDAQTIGATYSYGPGKLFLESNDVDGVNEDIYGASYKIGSVNFYLQTSSNADSSKDDTVAGVEYSF